MPTGIGDPAAPLSALDRAGSRLQVNRAKLCSIGAGPPCQVSGTDIAIVLIGY